MWNSLEDRHIRESLVSRLAALRAPSAHCPAGAATASALLAARAHAQAAPPRLSAGAAGGAAAWSLESLGLRGLRLGELLADGFPIFGALAWLSEQVVSDESSEARCDDKRSREFQAILAYHVDSSPSVPLLPALEYVAAAAAEEVCPLGQAAALLSIALSHGQQAESTEMIDEVMHLVGRADVLIGNSGLAAASELAALGREWRIWPMLHRLARAVSLPPLGPEELGGCIIMIYAYPTAEIRADTEEALRALEQYYLGPLGVRYPLVVFTDPATAPSLHSDFGALVSSPILAAVIPAEELERPMASYTCTGGIRCEAGRVVDSASHRGVVNGSQFWSADYLRISRYTAGELFLHSALDACGTFLKIDTDFYFTAPFEKDPIREMQREGTRLGYWQIHVQGQRQAGYMDAALGFLTARDVRIRNPAFHARGRFEEKAAKLGIDVAQVPEALEAATLIYGCLFGGDVNLFREPLYRDFFKYMDAQRGFEGSGWSNQFFLGTTAAAFLFPSEVRRMYLSGRHQEAHIEVGRGNVTEFLLGARKNVFR